MAVNISAVGKIFTVNGCAVAFKADVYAIKAGAAVGYAVYDRISAYFKKSGDVKCTVAGVIALFGFPGCIFKQLFECR